MTAIVVLLSVAVAVLALVVVGLLRSHAAILRTLHELGVDLDGRGLGGAPSAPGRELPQVPAAGPPETEEERMDTQDRGAVPAPPPTETGRPAADITGATPDGGAAGVRVTGVRNDTVLAFLSSGCRTCQTFWDELDGTLLPVRTRLVVVTKGPEDESPVAVADLAPPGVTVVMSSVAWADYEVPGSPYFVHVDGPLGRVRGEGTGPDWIQVSRMLREAAGDVDLRGGTRSRRRAARDGKASADAEREAQVDEILLASGIAPGDPSLYPGRRGE